MTALYVPGCSLRLLGHAAHGPAPARQLARRRHVGLVLVDAALEHRSPPVDVNLNLPQIR